ncbi:MAG: CoA-binding protein [Desulfobacterales bacterium]
MGKDIVEQLDPIFKPRSIAIIGASKDPTKWGGMMLDSVLSSQYRGRVYPVNPQAKRIRGVKAYPSVLDIPGDVDLAVFTVPAKHMPGVMAQSVEKGVKGGLVISADFAETGETGRKLQEETVKIARKGGIRFVGPNGNGLQSSISRLSLCPFPLTRPGPVGFITQSGTFGGLVTRAAMEKGFGISKFVAIGNQADLTVADYIEYLSHDKDTQVIGLYVEGIKDGRRFLDVARQVSKEKPIIAVKGGGTEHGARATLSHTASIAGTDEIFDAMCRQAGIIRVPEVGHLFTMAEALCGQPIPKGNRIAIIANGGQGVAISDCLSRLGMDVPEFTPSDARALKNLMPPHAPTPRNPVDYAAGAMDPQDEIRVVEMLASLDYVDGIITNVPRDRGFGAMSLAEQKKAGIDALDQFCQIPQKFGKPVITNAWFSDESVSEFLHNAGIPMYSISEDCARAMDGLVKYGEIQRRKG